MSTNISPSVHPELAISHLFTVIGQPARVQILLAIGSEAACVCHLEIVLGMRQASISQHLMILRKAGLVTTQREGRNIFYRIADSSILALLRQGAVISGIAPDEIELLALRPVPGCSCPQCNPGIHPLLACKSKT